MSKDGQLVDFQRARDKDGRWHLETAAKLLRQAATEPSQRKFAIWLRKQKIHDRGLLQFLLRLLDVHIGKKATLGEFGKELLETLGGVAAGGAAPPGALAPTENEAFLQMLFDRFVELNGYLVQFVFNEIGEDFLAPHEMYRRIGTSAYLGERPGMQALEVWLAWLEWLGYMKTIGFRKQLTERGREAWQSLKDVPVEELLGGAGALGVLAGLADEDPSQAAAEQPDEPAYIVAADLPENQNVPRAEPPGATPIAAEPPANDDAFDELDEELPDFGPDGAPPEATASLEGEKAQTERPPTEEELEAIRELFGDEALETLVEAHREERGENGDEASAAETTLTDPKLREPIEAVDAATRALFAGLDAAAAGSPSPPASEPAGANPTETMTPSAGATAAAPEPEEKPSGVAVETKSESETTEARAAGAEIQNEPAPQAPASPSVSAALDPESRARVRTETLAALWEVQPGRRPLRAIDLGIEQADEAWGYTLFKLSLAAALMEGEAPAEQGLGLFRTLVDVGALRGLYTGKLKLDEILEPPTDGAIGDNPHGRAIERLAYLPWIRRACRDRQTLSRLAKDPVQRPARLRRAMGGALTSAVFWVDREMRRLGIWR